MENGADGKGGVRGVSEDSGWFLEGNSHVIGPAHGMHQHIGRGHDWKQSHWVACRCRLALAGSMPLRPLTAQAFSPAWKKPPNSPVRIVL